eukprot:2235906-Amphidinium_carterae.1
MVCCEQRRLGLESIALKSTVPASMRLCLREHRREKGFKDVVWKQFPTLWCALAVSGRDLAAVAR